MPRAQQVLPKYLQIANAIRDQILDGTLGPGDEVASERTLVVDWNVARPTAARALAELRRLGLVESIRGAGTFVAGTTAERAEGRFRSFQERGTVYSPFEHAEILGAEVVEAPPEVATALGLSSHSKVIRRRRRTLEGEHPNEVSVSWFDADLVDVAPRLLQQERILEGTTAYVEQTTGRVATSAEDRESARLANEEEAHLLEIALGSPLLVTEHRVLDASGLPLEWAQSASPGQRWTPIRSYLLRP